MTQPVKLANTLAHHRFSIPVPCAVSWDEMTGDNRVRHCGDCKKNVFDLSAMTESEAAALVAGNVKGELCVKFYRRQDGTVMTSDCGAAPESFARPAPRSLPRLVGAAVLALSAAGCSTREAAPVDNVVTVSLDMVSPESTLMMGSMVIDEFVKPPPARKVPRAHGTSRKAQARPAAPDGMEASPTSEPMPGPEVDQDAQPSNQDLGTRADSGIHT
ncbi:hypothetical protein F2P44_11295 [Massilia sp. CCM 8695]|uniref:Lipoprotein n=1 Tax=Massilia frigida TaxID=2609281 RepID=A0ABX0N9D0_9BURK|nr:hypothetical protein [Massilia frigida]NHZ79856.1 hypothetical protein [Massilia frigida]